jgi:hypothetical protein
MHTCRLLAGRSLSPSSLLFALVLLVVSTGPAAAATASSDRIAGLFLSPELSLTPPQGLLIDAWYKLELLGQPVGYMRTATRRQADRIETLEYTLIQVARGSARIKIIVKNLTIETLEGKPLEIHTEQVFASQPVHYDAVFQSDGAVDLAITQGDNTVHRTLPADPATTFPWQMIRQSLAGKRKAGESFTERGYAFVSDTKPLSVEHLAQGQASVRLPDGRDIQTWRYKVTDPSMGGEGEVYCEPRVLLPVRFEIPVMAMRFTATLATREVATALADEPAKELFISTLLKVRVRGGADPSKAAGVVYAIHSTDNDPKIHLPTTDMQRTLDADGGDMHLLVRRRTASALPADALSPADLAPYLAATTYCNINDEAVRKLAVEGAGAEKDPRRLAESLTRFVYQKMTHKGLDVAFATASEVARTLQGDCTEHATLLAALARANKLPARGVFGMVALPGSYAGGMLTFGYHMWTQVYVAGRWMDIDAALNQPVPDPTHIALGITDLADTSLPLESVKTFMQIAGKVQVTAETKP